MFLEKLQEQYGKDLKNFESIYTSEYTSFYLIETSNNIELVRVYKYGDEYKLKIEKTISLTDNIFQSMAKCIKYGMGIQKWMG
jgi:hypothetical protein